MIIFVYLYLTGCNNDNRSLPLSKKTFTSQHSTEFNSGFNALLNSYHDLTHAFIDWDTLEINNKAAAFGKLLDSLPAVFHKKDSVVSSEKIQDVMTALKKDIHMMMKEQDITLKRRQLNVMSKKVYSFLTSARYDNARVYLHVCPMAFNDVDSGYWLSKKSEISNPYMGLHHPRYGRAMLECGETIDSINYIK